MEKPFVWEARIRFVDTDASGRIHYTSMFRHFEAAEQEYLRTAECAYATPDLEGFTFPRVHVECDFSAEIRFDDLVRIEVSVDRVGRSSFTWSFRVTNRGALAAAGKVTVVAMDRTTQRACSIPSTLEAALRRLLL